ncbi:clarin-3 [Gadus chalcogrammus]|uniref:clarin-3 n=1 Tax=Gadus chalcogrammus TaxID=1042646 RepID=UPI0024C4E2C2|nr:clarin-3 [Gadus chalcogrammus]
MPSATKILYFFSSALASSISVGLLGFSMSTTWTRATMECAADSANTTFANGTATITLDLFDMISERTSCPAIGSRPEEFKVFTVLGNVGTAPQVLHGLVVMLLALCLLASCGSILIALYNSVSNPYETYMGPIGIYVCSSVGACVSLLVLVLFVINLFVNRVAEELVIVVSKLSALKVQNTQVSMGLGYYLVLPYLALTLMAIGFVYLYQHAAYRHQREQQRPTEEPKDVLMY